MEVSVVSHTEQRVWEIEDGIVTREKYDNFELKLEWKVEPESNSGIFFHVEELDDAKTVYATGPEYQLLDDMGFEGKLKDAQYSGANYDMEAPAEHLQDHGGTTMFRNIKIKAL